MTRNQKEPENDEASSDLPGVALVLPQRRLARIAQASGAKAPQ